MLKTEMTIMKYSKFYNRGKTKKKLGTGHNDILINVLLNIVAHNDNCIVFNRMLQLANNIFVVKIIFISFYSSSNYAMF